MQERAFAGIIKKMVGIGQYGKKRNICWIFFETEQLVLYKTDGTTTIMEGLVEPDMIYTDDGSANI